MDERKIRGGAIIGLLDSIKIKWGMQGLEDAMKYANIESMPKNGEWYPLEKMYKILEWIDKNHGEKYIIAVGRSMPRHMAGDLKFMFAQFIGFERMLKRVQKEISKMMFKDNGVTIVKNEKREAIVTLKNVNTYEKSCLLWKGALLGVLDLSKTNGNVDVISGKDDLDCKLKVKWE